MSDPMDEIGRLLKKAPTPEQNKIVEKQTIEKALAAFDKKNASAAQGTSFLHRLMGTARTVLNLNDGASMKTAYKIGGGLCAATLAIALLTTTSLQSDFRAMKEEGKAQPKELIVAAKPTEPTIKDSAGIGFNAGAVAEKKAAPEAEADNSRAIAVPTEQQLTIQPPSIPAPASMPAPPPAAIELGQAEIRARGDMSGGAAANMAMSKGGGTVGAVSSSMIAPGIIAPEPMPQQTYHGEGRDRFEHVAENPLKQVASEPVSTFSVDVDTASYAFTRSSIMNGRLPQKDAVRIEEMVNYFPYDYKKPADKSQPFASTVSVMPTPWNKGTKLVHIGIKGYELQQASKPHSNLVFLLDTSGSMNEPNKLPLLVNSLKLLLDNLKDDDTVAIVTYAGNAGVALEPTLVRDKLKIIQVLSSLTSGGGTAGADGIRTAYDLAQQHFDKGGVNRVILATDGDFNVGITDQNELKSFIEKKRDTGIFLSVLGFGQGNYNDALMQTLAQNGNGNAAYIDTLNEARKVLVDEAGSTLFTIAKDVKLQVEFNPATVSEYRLIGYETRQLQREDFNNDHVDAGDIGAGHTVTAIYEITPKGSNAKLVDDLRYGTEKKEVVAPKNPSGEYAFLKIRYKLPKQSTSKLITTPIDSKLEVGSIEAAPADARFAVAVAGFGQLLRGDSFTKEYSYDDVTALAKSAKGADEFGYRAEFINLVRLAKTAAGLDPSTPGRPRTGPIVYPTPSSF
ncbi:MAG: vWA domain-containing protein [Rickettsiales bacterium]